MGREVRMVPAKWEHPKDEWGHHITLHDRDILRYCKADDSEEDQINPESLMPNFPKDECTHLMMYENVSEGTPISPSFATPEELAKWLSDNKASAGGLATASYDQWFAMIKQGYAPSGFYSPSTGYISGVAFCKESESPDAREKGE